MSNADQFFEEEEELARKEAASQERRAKRPQARPATVKPQASGTALAVDGARKPPSLGMVVAIAAVALVLGVCIGYFIAMAVVDRGGASAGASSQTSAQGAATDGGASTSGSEDEVGMPEGHPDIASLLNEDGTVNEEALAEYKAQRAAEAEDEDADAGAEGSDGAADGSSE